MFTIVSLFPLLRSYDGNKKKEHSMDFVGNRKRSAFDGTVSDDGDKVWYSKQYGIPYGTEFGNQNSSVSDSTVIDGYGYRRCPLSIERMFSIVWFLTTFAYRLAQYRNILSQEQKQVVSL